MAEWQGKFHQGKPDTALTSDEIEEKLRWLAIEANNMPEALKVTSLGNTWEISGTAKKPTDYDVVHLHINRLLDLREMLASGAITPVRAGE